MPGQKIRPTPGKMETLTVDETNAILKAAADCRIVPFWFAPFDTLASGVENRINGNSTGKTSPLLHQDLRMPGHKLEKLR